MARSVHNEKSSRVQHANLARKHATTVGFPHEHIIRVIRDFRYSFFKLALCVIEQYNSINCTPPLQLQE